MNKAMQTTNVPMTVGKTAIDFVKAVRVRTKSDGLRSSAAIHFVAGSGYTIIARVPPDAIGEAASRLLGIPIKVEDKGAYSVIVFGIELDRLSRTEINELRSLSEQILRPVNHGGVE